MKVRIPIALRLFIFVVSTSVLIITASLIGQHYQMQKNFARYVADVEMQKLDHLIETLESIFSIYGDWGHAIQAQIDMVQGQPDPEDYDRLSHWWLRRQYDIALQQLMFKEQTAQQLAGQIYQREQRVAIGTSKKNHEQFIGKLSPQEYEALKDNLPSEYNPFEGLNFPLRDSIGLPSEKPPMIKVEPQQNGTETQPSPIELDDKVKAITDSATDGLITADPEQFDVWAKNRKTFIFIPDRLGLSSRLSLYDKDWQFVVGDPSPAGEVSYRPLKVDGQVIGYLGLKATLEQKDALSINFFDNQQRYLWSIYALAIIASLIISLLLAEYFKRPIQRLLLATRELSQGNYQYQVNIKRHDELGDLSNTVNRLAEILYQHEQSRKQWVADTSHELKTPLAVLQAQIEAMQDGIRKATPEHLDAMQRQVQSLKKLTQDLADLAQADVQQLSHYPSEVSVWQVVLQEVEQFRPKFEQADLSIEINGIDAIAYVDTERFKQIIVNLLQNSIRYTTAGGKVHIHSELHNQQWLLFVDDSPLGVTDEQLQRLGERFYRVDDSRTRSTGGTGLGLALCVRIAQMLGGELKFDHSPLGGLRCCLSLPVLKK